MSTDGLLAKEPKRERGKKRVALLLDAGAALFIEKGYEATTMTEIAARAGAAIGSLYQFFPSKQALAEALFKRYSAHAVEAFEEVSVRAPELTPVQLAQMLVKLMLDLRSDRNAAISANNTIADMMERRIPLRNAMRGCLTQMLRSLNPRLSEAQVATAAVLIAQIMKMVRPMADEEAASGQSFVAETQKLLAIYLSDLLKS